MTEDKRSRRAAMLTKSFLHGKPDCAKSSPTDASRQGGNTFSADVDVVATSSPIITFPEPSQPVVADANARGSHTNSPAGVGGTEKSQAAAEDVNTSGITELQLAADDVHSPLDENDTRGYLSDSSHVLGTPESAQHVTSEHVTDSHYDPTVRGTCRDVGPLTALDDREVEVA